MRRADVQSFILNLSTSNAGAGVSGELHAPATLSPGKESTVSTEEKTGWAPEPLWSLWWKDLLFLSGLEQFLLSTASSLITTPSTEYRFYLLPYSFWYYPPSMRRYSKWFLPFRFYGPESVRISHFPLRATCLTHPILLDSIVLQWRIQIMKLLNMQFSSTYCSNPSSPLALQLWLIICLVITTWFLSMF
jgi:hypothetical protein